MDRSEHLFGLRRRVAAFQSAGEPAQSTGEGHTTLACGDVSPLSKAPSSRRNP